MSKPGIELWTAPNTFEMKRSVFEKHLQNLDIKSLETILDKTNLAFAIDLLSVDKNIKLLSKKSDFDFLSKIFKKMSLLNNKHAHLQFLKVSKDFFVQEVHSRPMFNYDKSIFKTFIEKVVDLSISQNKKHNFQDIQKICSIAKIHDISDNKLTNWIGKICSHSNNPVLLDEVFKLPLLNKSEQQKRFVAIILNMSKNISLLDKIFSKYESTVYELNIKYKEESSTWNCLLPSSSWYGKNLPYIDNDKLQWFEDKKIGYKNHPVFFELYSLSILFSQAKNSNYFKEEFNLKINEEHSQNLIFESLQQYHRNFLPEKELLFPASTKKHPTYNEQIEIKNWVNESPIRSVLGLYDSNNDFYNFCKTLNFKNNLETKLVNQFPDSIKQEKKLKI